MTITEDTPEEDSVEMLQWKIDQLVEQVERHTAELRHQREVRNSLQQSLSEKQELFDNLTARLKIGDLRKAGFTVEIKPPEVCDTCGEDY